MQERVKKPPNELGGLLVLSFYCDLSAALCSE